MKEDLKILELTIEDSKDYGQYCLTRTELDALEHLIKAYKELEEFKKQVTEIENTNFIKYKNYIPVSLVEEKIEEYTKLLKNCNRFSDVDRIKAINERILAYKELLEKRK